MKGNVFMLARRFLRFHCALVVLALVGWPALGQAVEPGKKGDPAHGLKVFAQLLPADGKQPLRLSIVADIPPGWHIYSITQKPGGPKRSIIQIKESPQFRLAGSLVAAPPPTVEREKYKEIWPDLNVEEHAGRVTWTAPLEVAAGTDVDTLAVEGLIKVFMCSDVCVDVTLPFTARLAANDEANLSSQATHGLASAVSLLAIAAPAEESVSAVGSAQKLPLPTETKLSTPQIAITGQLDREVVAPGETATITFHFQPAAGWHIYQLGDIRPAVGGYPTRIVISAAAGLNIGPPTAPDAKTKQQKIEGGSTETYYEGAVQIQLPVQVPQTLAPGTYFVSGAIGYQTCKKQCLNPTGARFSIPITIGEASKGGTVPVKLAKASYPPTPQEKLAGEPVAAVAPNAEIPPTTTAQLGNEAFTVSLFGSSHAGTYGFGFDLILAFLGGLILNAMPCVLPVVGLKVMSFVQQAGENRGRVFVLNAWFSLGMMSVFLVWAALIAFFSLAASAQFQRPEFSVTLAAVTFAFALSLLGIWEIPLPALSAATRPIKWASVRGRQGPLPKAS